MRPATHPTTTASTFDDFMRASGACKGGAWVRLASGPSEPAVACAAHGRR
jgi:hypothetical protein